MAETGILDRDDRVELLDGEIVEMSPIGSRHAACVSRLNRVFVRALGDRALVRVQDPVRLSTHDEPRPDVAIVHPRDDFYAGSHPGPRETLLLIEVADTSLSFDTGKKLGAYAKAGVPEVWIVDLSAGRVLVRREPKGETYAAEETRGRGQALELAAFPDVVLGVEEILPD